MIFVSLTRLRVRSVRFMPGFFLYAMRSLRQVRRAAGFQSGALLPDRDRTFWTMTAWDSEENMRAYMVSGAHKQAMPKLLHWCDEASVAHWVQQESALPSWEQADERMRREGRASKVLHPSAAHAGLSYKAPRTIGSAPITPA
jgi:heme-degrading monooxygenase HmoA